MNASDTQAVEIASKNRFTSDLFGSCILSTTDGCPCPDQSSSCSEFCCTEIDQDELTSSCYDSLARGTPPNSREGWGGAANNVGRLDVAVDDFMVMDKLEDR